MAITAFAFVCFVPLFTLLVLLNILLGKMFFWLVGSIHMYMEYKILMTLLMAPHRWRRICNNRLVGNNKLMFGKKMLLMKQLLGLNWLTMLELV